MLIRPAKRSFGRMAINAVVPTFSKTQFASAAVAQQLPYHDPTKVSSTTKMPLFTKFHPLDDHSLLSSNTKLRRGRARGKQSLVIFDKDGTLICFHSMWVPWAKAVVERLCVASKMPIGEKLYEMLGFCPVQSRVVTGLLAHGTLGQIRERIVALLMEHGMAEGRALELVRNVVRDCDTSCPNTLRQLHDLHKVFSSLKARQIKIAICTADSRPATLSTMRALRLEPYVDFVMCGDDPMSKPKPSPHNALYICQALDVQPEDALMVGDTLADMGMGRSARLGATVGVLSGIGRREELRPQADHIVNHVGELLTIIDGNPDPVDIHISNARPRHHNPCEFLPSCM